VVRVRTFKDQDSQIEGELARGPTSTGLCVVKLDDGSRVVRHRTGLTPLDDEARAALEAQS